MSSEEINLYKEPFKRTLKKRSKSSSPEAVEKMKQEVEEYTDKIAERASSLAEHADRKTIKPQDMEKAIRQLNQEN